MEKILKRTFTCPICDSVVSVGPEAEVKACECECMRVDFDPLYVRTSGWSPVESQDPNSLPEVAREAISKARQRWHEQCRLRWKEKS